MIIKIVFIDLKTDLKFELLFMENLTPAVSLEETSEDMEY